MLRLFLIVMALAGLSACQTKNEADTAAGRRIVDSLNAKVEGWYATNQPDSVASVFASNAWQMPPNDAPLIGQDSIRTFWRNMLKMGTWAFDLRAEDVMAADSMLVERGQYTVKFTPGANAPIPAFDDRGNYVTVWRRQNDGAWRILWDAAVSSVPRNATPVDTTTVMPSS